MVKRGRLHQQNLAWSLRRGGPSNGGCAVGGNHVAVRRVEVEGFLIDPTLECHRVSILIKSVKWVDNQIRLCCDDGHILLTDPPKPLVRERHVDDGACQLTQTRGECFSRKYLRFARCVDP